MVLRWRSRRVNYYPSFNFLELWAGKHFLLKGLLYHGPLWIFSHVPSLSSTMLKAGNLEYQLLNKKTGPAATVRIREKILCL